ncbi:MAG TPA: fibronectin type III domain-containing protein [Methanomassiliicoccales archaeon]|nr:fibronectin type III domain-containing protein [Methanomassiliicoccales archaeon]
MGAVLPIVPGAPTDLTAVVVDGKVVIEWDIPSFDGGRLITGYILYRSDGTNGSFAAMIAPITGPKYTDGDVTKGQTYWYHVAAVNANGVGAHSEEVSVEIKAADGGDSTVLIPGTVLAIAMLLVVVFFFARWKK